jgi:hypothetical protein
LSKRRRSGLDALFAERERIIGDVKLSRVAGIWGKDKQREKFFAKLSETAFRRKLGDDASCREFAATVLSLVRPSVEEGYREASRHERAIQFLDRTAAVLESIDQLDLEIKVDPREAENLRLTWERLAEAAQPLRNLLHTTSAVARMQGIVAPHRKPGPSNLPAVKVCEMVAAQYYRCFRKRPGGAGRRGTQSGGLSRAKPWSKKRDTPYQVICGVVQRYLASNGRPETLTDTAMINGFKRWSEIAGQPAKTLPTSGIR